MSDVVEIYSVRGNQPIRDGALDLSHTISNKREAEADARIRCQRDRTIKKVAYYVVRDDGSFRTLFTYDNPDALTMRRRGPRRQMADTLPRGNAKPPPRTKRKRKLVERLVEALKD